MLLNFNQCPVSRMTKSIYNMRHGLTIPLSQVQAVTEESNIPHIQITNNLSHMMSSAAIQKLSLFECS